MQSVHETMTVPAQLAELIAVTGGVFDPLQIDQINEAAKAVRDTVVGELPELCDQMLDGQTLTSEQREEVRCLALEAVKPWVEKSTDGNT